nr:protein kinase, ATP binding site-containing protein [Tanacetum cinerariifolium]
RGLQYLHDPEGTQQRVLHRDIKSANILLDENWKVKVSDFGLSKFGPANQQFTFLVSNTVGTFGYCDPLYIETGYLTKESDVCSFGVVLFEVLCGRFCIENHEDFRRFLPTLALKSYREMKLDTIIFNCLRDEFDTEEFWKTKLLPDSEDIMKELNPIAVYTNKKELFSLLHKGVFFDNRERDKQIQSDDEFLRGKRK